MVSKPGVMAQIIHEAMDDYWRVVYSKTDEGLSPAERKWKRDHQNDMHRMVEKWGDKWEKEFSKL